MALFSNFLVFLGLCTLFGASFATEKCTSVLFGQQTLNLRSMTRAYFSPGTKLQEIHLHTGCESVGVLVTACDDFAPNVYVKSSTEALVDRLGSFNYLGYADIVAYCSSPNAPLIVSPKPQLIESFTGSVETQ